MKVTLNPDGSVDFDCSTPEEAVALARRLQNGSAAKVRKAPPPPPQEPVEEVVEVSSQLMDVWNYLVANDCSSGSAITEVANSLSLTSRSARVRLGRLVRFGLAHEVSKGMYRPGEG